MTYRHYRKLAMLTGIISVLAIAVVYFVIRRPSPPKIDYTQRAGTESKTPAIALPDIGPWEAVEGYWPADPWTPIEYTVPEPLTAGKWYVFTGRVLVNKPADGPYQFRTYTAPGIVPPTVNDVQMQYKWVDSKPHLTEVESDGPYTVREYKYLVRAPKESGPYSFFITNMAMLAPHEHVFLRAVFEVQSPETEQ